MSALSAAAAAPSRSEQELIAAVRRGDDRAFEELYARYRQRIGSYVFGMVGDHQRAEDVAQEVFIAALRRLRDTERPIAFKPWLYEIAKNACIDEFRRARRAQEVPLDSDRDDVTPGRLIAHGADSAVEHKQRLDDLRGAFHGLSESHHRILVMRELEGRSYTQIGERLGMTKPVVESTLFRARRKLSEEYEELVTGRRCERVQHVIDAEGERPLRSLGIKERRLLARHLAHCQPCRRHARMAGVDESFFKTPSIAAKLAALLPFPWLRLRRGHGGEGSASASSAGTPRSVAAVQSLQNVAPYVDPSGPAGGLGRAIAAAAAIVVAGAGGGLVTGAAEHNRMPRPPVVHPVPARPTHTGTPAATGSAGQPAAVPAAAWHSATPASGTRRTKDRIKRSAGSSSRSGSHSGQSGTGGSGGSGAGSASRSSSPSSGLSSVTSGAGTAAHHPLSSAAAAASKLLSGASGGGSGSSSGSGSGIQLPSVGSVSLPKVPLNLSSGSSSSSSSTSSSSTTTSSIPSPQVPGAPDPNKVISSLTGH